MSARLRAVIAGAGLMGRWHRDAIEAASGVVAGVCDRDLERARALARDAVAGPDLEVLTRDLRPDVIHVCTPVATHHALAAAALDARAHVVIEKPLAASLEEAEDLLDRAAKAGCVVVPVHQLAFQRWLPRVVRVGDVLDLAYSTCSAGAAGGGDAAADAVADEILPHPLSLFARIRPGVTAAAAWRLERSRPGEVRVLGAAAGLALSISISMGGRPTRNELRVTGTAGTLVADLFHGYAWVEGGHVSRGYKVARPFAVAARMAAGAAANLARRTLAGQGAYPGLRELVAAVYAGIRGTGPPAFDPAELLGIEQARARILGRR